MSLFRRIGSHLRHVTQALGSTLWQRTPENSIDREDEATAGDDKNRDGREHGEA